MAICHRSRTSSSPIVHSSVHLPIDHPGEQLDPEGVIRYTELRGEELEKAVNFLLERGRGLARGVSGLSRTGQCSAALPAAASRAISLDLEYAMHSKAILGAASRRLPIALALLAGLAAGTFRQSMAGLLRADDRTPAHASPGAVVKAPVAEVLHCPLAFAGVHLLKDMPEVSQVAYHFCKPLNDDLSQCLLYDGTGPDARLIGTEYLVSQAVYDGMPADEKAYWHDHKYEVDSGLIRSLTQTGDEEKATLAKVRTLYGKIYHTWNSGKTYPRGPARLYWSATGEEPFVVSPKAEMPAELRRGKTEPHP